MNKITKSQLIDYLERTDIHADQLQQLYYIVHALPYKDKIEYLLTTQKLINKSAIELIYNEAVTSNNYIELFSVLSNDAVQLNIDLIPSYGNLFYQASHLNLSDEFLIWLSNLVPYTSVKMGRYEMFLRILFKGGRTPVSHGDVEINSKSVEVKSTVSKGSGFRLRGQYGYGNGVNVSKKYIELLNMYYNNDIPLYIQQLIKETNSQVWYVTKTGWMNMAIQDLMNSNRIVLENAADIWAYGLLQVYLTSNKDEIINRIILPCIQPDGTINTKEMLYYLAAYEFYLYKSSEKFDYFITLNYKNNYLLMADMSFDELVDTFKLYFNITAPNTKSKATAQDCVCSIELK
jgi:hypothetical protein